VPSREATQAVSALFTALSAHAPAWLVDLHPAYGSILLEFDGRAVDHDAVERFVRGIDRAGAGAGEPVSVLVPVVYDGPDLADVAAHAGLSVDDVIARHSAPAYTVAFSGFMPGFAYLLGLDSALEVPRLAVPRRRVDAGAVAIAGKQAAIYPSPSPGGWRILGRTSLVLTPEWVRPGDIVRFIPAPGGSG
jgi:KipI family sensor histidine kinase inhibitor